MSRIVPQPSGFLSLQFGLLWCVFYAALVLLAVVEITVLRHRGAQYIPKSALRHVTVGDVCVSADGQWALARMGFRCSSAEARIIDDVVVYDFAGQSSRRLHLSQLQPRCLAISPTARCIAIACADRSIYVCNGLASGATGSERLEKELRLLHRVHDTGIARLVFSPDGQQLAAVGARYLHVLRCREGGLAARWAWESNTASVTFADDSRTLIWLSLDGQVCWWDTHSAWLIDTQVLAPGPMEQTALSTGGRLAAVMRADGSASVWNLQTGTELWRHALPSFHWNASHTIAFSPAGDLLVHACWTHEQYQINCYDALSGQRLGQSPHYRAIFKGMVVTSDNLVYSWDHQGVIRAWNAGQDREQWRCSWPFGKQRGKGTGGLPGVSSSWRSFLELGSTTPCIRG